MEVYIEYVIIDNLIMNYLILFFTKLLANSKIKKINLWISNLFGVACAVLLPLVSINTVFLLLIKLTVGVTMVTLLKRYNNFKNFFAHLLLFFTFTFVFGGACYGILNLLNIPTSASGVLINGYELPMGLIMGLVGVYVYLMIKLVKYVRHKNDYANCYYDVTLLHDGKRYCLRGFLDTGNKLYDTDGSPIVVISFKTFCKLFSHVPIQNYFLNQTEKLGLKGAHYINVSNVVGGGKMLVFSGDELCMQNDTRTIRNDKFLIGISNKNFSTEYECLLHSEFFKGGIM